jgi:hypothetical protein
MEAAMTPHGSRVATRQEAIVSAEQDVAEDLHQSTRLEGVFESFSAVRTVPRLYVQDGFASPDEVAHILAITSDLAAWSAKGLSVKSDFTGTSFELPVAHDPAVQALTERTYDLLGVRNRVDSTVRFRRYGPGDWHPSHTDTYQISGFHLVATAMITLQGPDEGGETEFPLAAPPVMLPARTGRLAMWLNLLPNGDEDLRASHASLPVEAGDKVTITNFIYAAPRCSLVWRGPARLAG